MRFIFSGLTILYVLSALDLLRQGDVDGAKVTLLLVLLCAAAGGWFWYRWRKTAPMRAQRKQAKQMEKQLGRKLY